jgi:hypothetical protein
VDQGKNCRIRSDAERNREDDGDGKAGRFRELPEGEFQVGHDLYRRAAE